MKKTFIYNEIEIRKATENDKKIVYDLICQLENTLFEYSIFEKFYLKNLQDSTIIYLIAEDKEKTLGFLSCHGQPLLHHLSIVYEIQELVVKSEYKGQYIGTKLIEFLERLLSENTTEALLLEVTANKKREQSHNFYKKNGFKETNFKFTKIISLS